jgi:hypothetical protein
LTPLEPVVRKVERATALDSATKPIGRTVRGLLPKEPVKDAAGLTPNRSTMPCGEWG